MTRLKELREATVIDGKKLSGLAVAEKIGTSVPHYYKIENGDRPIPDYLAKKLAHLFNVSIDYLLGKTEEKKETPADIVQRFDRDLRKMPPEEVLEHFKRINRGKVLNKTQEKVLLKHLYFLVDLLDDLE
ncbi:helix-turn-helix transcriptional regulator [Bacillus sp. FSL W7-1360]